jgi:hypothetical protein
MFEFEKQIVLFVKNRCRVGIGRFMGEQTRLARYSTIVKYELRGKL